VSAQIERLRIVASPRSPSVTTIHHFTHRTRVRALRIIAIRSDVALAAPSRALARANAP
jgi:hypothetical protein